jgi:proteasome lid subunit RPN8/RPN11
MIRQEADSLKKCLDIIGEHALKDYPSECCGVVLASKSISANPSQSYEVFLCTNIQDKMHANEPDTYTRDSGTAYLIDPAEQTEVFISAKAEELQIVAFYHSHIDCGVYFSDEDKRLATWGDEPTFPDTAYIIVSVEKGKVADSGIFIWDKAGRDFIKSPIRIK